MCCCFNSKRSFPAPPSAPDPPPTPHRRSQHHPRRGGGAATNSSSVSPPSSSSASATTSSSSSLNGLRYILPSGPIHYRLSEISNATDQFSPSKKISRSVWKSTIHGVPVAISRQPRGGGGASSTSSLARSLRRLHSLHHSSIAKLLGACFQVEYVYLVYEFVEGSNLADCLSSRLQVEYTPLSSWLSRLQIAIDVAKGLEYLHHHCAPTIVHKYLDSRNVLVSNDLRAKIAHLGVAAMTGEIEIGGGRGNAGAESEQSGEIGGGDKKGGGKIGSAAGTGRQGDSNQQQSMSRRAAANGGTVKINGIQGYMPPEYTASGEVSAKYDVYAFGVILAELLSGRVVTEAGLRKGGGGIGSGKKRTAAEELLRAADPKAELRLWMDGRLRDSYPMEDALRVAEMARSCMKASPGLRPDMADVASTLQKYLFSAQRWQQSIDARLDVTASSFRPR